ncbi:MAG: hypothetical protein HUJ69_04495 [Lachnospiraceae bacterium]|nr:hypothetical protein [Lachnospiraceae bacterium]
MVQLFTLALHGYNTQEVNSYIDELQQIIEQRNREILSYKEKLSLSETASTEEKPPLTPELAALKLKELADRTRQLKEKTEQMQTAYETMLQDYLSAAAAQSEQVSALLDDLDLFLEDLKDRQNELHLSPCQDTPSPDNTDVPPLTIN